MTKAKMWFGKVPCVPYQLQKWYGICHVCHIGAGATALGGDSHCACECLAPFTAYSIEQEGHMMKDVCCCL